MVGLQDSKVTKYMSVCARGGHFTIFQIRDGLEGGYFYVNTCQLKKLWRGQEDKRKPRTSELFDSETLKQFKYRKAPRYNDCNLSLFLKFGNRN